MRYFSEANFRGNHAGTKARNDADAILKAYGARPINTRVLELRDSGHEYIKSNIANRLGFVRYFWDLLFVRKETVVIQYPMLAFDIQYEYVNKLSKNNTVVFLVHDVQSLRRNDPVGLKKEIEILNLADILLVHNRFMEKKLSDLGICPKKFIRLQCFDYLFEGKIQDHSKQFGVAFAGNLEKSEFLEHLCAENDQITFNFYGPGWNSKLEHADNAVYEGSFNPDEIPEKLQGRYGLIWDGKTTTECSGIMGEYTKINNPHKMSLYIAAGMPVIAWKDAAIAEFISENGIGVVVERINNLQTILNSITEQQYMQMRENICKIRNSLICGEYLKKALFEAEKGVD